MERRLKRICVFCASNAGNKLVYAEAARALGRLLVERGLGLVYGGGNVGLMGVIADAVVEARGEAIGVIPQALVDRELAHRGLAELHVVASMHARKQLMHELADGFIALPGGFGTLEELLETLTWGQLGLHAKPCGVLNVEGFYDPLLVLLDRAVDDGLLRREHRRLLLVDASAPALLDRFTGWEAPSLPKWIDRRET
jgi:uncharacterized protein (TIGR00730 family)